MDPGKFLRTWGVGFVSTLAALAAFNVSVDPYLMFDTRRISGFNARKAENTWHHELMIKAYDAPRSAPRTLVLGSSVVDFGLDSLDPAWPARVLPIYNLGFIGNGDPRLGYLYLQHVLSKQNLDLVVLSLDFQVFLTGGPKHSDPAIEARLNTDGNGIQNRQRVLDTLHASISLDATLDSISTVAASIDNDGVNFIGGNIPVRNQSSIPVMDLFLSTWYQQARMDLTMMPFVRAILDLCEHLGIDVIVLINPTHADALEIFDLIGQWDAFEDWKRELVMLTSKYDAPGNRHNVRLWDFSGYHPTTIGIATSGYGWEACDLWMDSVHYTSALGSRILRRIFALDRENIEAHIDAIRQRRGVYRQTYPADVQRVFAIFEDARQYQWE